jgi:flagellar assembly protein FliH
MTSFEAEAKALLEKAKGQVQEMFRKAAEEAKKIQERARQEGFQKGLEEGKANGAEQEKARVAQETAGLAGILQKIAEGIEQKRRGMEAASERDLMRLAIAVAERIVKREVKKNVPVTWENLKHAVALTARRESLEVRLNPKDEKVIKKYMPELKKRFTEVADVRLAGDDSVEQGGCVVVTREGQVDAQLKTQLEEIERQLLT